MYYWMFDGGKIVDERGFRKLLGYRSKCYDGKVVKMGNK